MSKLLFIVGTKACGGNIQATSISKTINSNEIPNILDNELCQWTITAPEGSVITFEFESVDVSCFSFMIPMLLLGGFEMLIFSLQLNDWCHFDSHHQDFYDCYYQIYYVDNFDDSVCEPLKIRHGNYLLILDGENSDTSDVILETCYSSWEYLPKTSSSHIVYMEYAPDGKANSEIIIHFSHNGTDPESDDSGTGMSL